MNHEIVTVQSYAEILVTRGKVKGIYYPNDSKESFPFETNNLIIFNRLGQGNLRIAQVIFNRINPENIQKKQNPFNKFVGEWTLKENKWSQNWGSGSEHILIPNHYTLSKELNTPNSLLSIIDTEPKGHILWTYNPVKKEVNHLSNFGTSRPGVGKGTLNENGDLTLKVSFEGEPEGSYRLYTYKWISLNEYELLSLQLGKDDKPTKNFYSGTFIRIDKNK